MADPSTLKGQCHEIFRFWFFSSISFPPVLEYPNRTVSNFFENSPRYSQLKVDHRCLDTGGKFAAGVVDTGGKFAAGIVDTGSKFATSVNNTSETGGKIFRRCR